MLNNRFNEKVVVVFFQIIFIDPGVPYCVSVAAVNRAGQGNITTLTNFTKELGTY